MLECLIDSINVKFSGQSFQAVGIPMGINCALLLADLFLYRYEAEFVQGLIKAGFAYLFNCTTVGRTSD